MAARACVLLAALLVLMPCAHAAVIAMPAGKAPPCVPAAHTGDLTNIRTVAVISAIGQRFTVSRVSGWFNKTNELDIQDWRLDDVASAEVKNLLGSRFAFKDVAYDRSALAAIPNGSLRNSTGALKTYLQGVSNDDLDAFVVVRPDFETPAQGVEGLGVEVNYGVLTGRDLPVAWLNFEVDIVDAHSLAIIAKAFSRAQLRQGLEPSLAGFVLSNDFQPSENLSFTDNQQKALERVFKYFTTVTLTETLRSLNVGATLPETGARTLIAIPPDKDPFSAIKSVAVASAIGDTLNLAHIATVFSENETRLDVATWNLDTEVEAQVRNAVAKRFAVRDVGLERKTLLGLRLTDSDGKWRKTLDEVPPSSDVDAYILILKHKVELAPQSAAPMDGTGLGVYRNALGDGATVYANYAIALVDARTRKVLEAYVGVLPPSYPSQRARKTVDTSIWPDRPDAPTEAQARAIRANIDELIKASVPETLLQMLLTGQLAVHQLPTATSPTAAAR